MTIGFSVGTLSEHMRAREAMLFIKKLGCRAVEIGLRMPRLVDGQYDEIMAEDLAGFDYVSVHAPTGDYADTDETRAIVKCIERIHVLRPLDAIVVHPDTIQDFSFFSTHKLPFAFENMDNQKASGRTVGDIEAVLAKDDSFGFVLDVNHAYVNDPTMALAGAFYERCGNRLAHIHVSGYLGPKHSQLHVPLFETKQENIVRAIQGDNAPLIIESMMPSPEAARKELEYIASVLNRKNRVD